MSTSPPPGAYGRVLAVLLWLGLVFVVASSVLLVVASRVNETAATTFGTARTQFQGSWGAEIDQSMPSFQLRHTVRVSRWEDGREIARDEEVRDPLVPVDTELAADLEYDEKDAGWLSFQAFTAHTRGTFRVENTTGFPGDLLVTVTRPPGAALLYDYALGVDGVPVRGARIDTANVLAANVAPGGIVTVTLALATKGTDRFAFRVSEWKSGVVPRLHAVLHLNTDQFSLVQFGLPHTRTNSPEASTVEFSVKDFVAAQDVGVTFVSAGQDLDRVEELLFKSPAALALFLAGLFVLAQVREVRFAAALYGLVGVVHTFYFLFLAYLVRYVGLAAAVGLALGLMTLAFAVSAPPTLGSRFAWRSVFPYLLAMTLGFSVIFAIPVFRGVAFLTFTFAVFLALVAPLARTSFSRWPVIADG